MLLKDWLAYRLLRCKALPLAARLDRAAQRVTDAQRRLLLDQLRRERETGFGRDHKFASMRTLADFRRQVPIATYEYISPYIERVKAGETEALFPRERVLMFALTSGTSSARKFIPVTRRFVQSYRRGWFVWGHYAFSDYPDLLMRSKLTLTSDPEEFRTQSGVPCGSIGGLTARMQNPIVRHTYCLPPEAARIRDTAAKHYVAWRLGLMCDLGMWISPNPSTLVQLARFGEQQCERLIRDVYEGGLSPEFPIPASVARRSWKRLRPNRERARELERVVARTGGFRPKDLWPNLRLIGCWLGGTVGAYMRHFPEYFGEAAVRDIGLIASECRMTIPHEDGTSGGVLDVLGAFFEFIPIEEMDSPQPTVLEAHELDEGRDYYILLTTPGGLYRYNIFDVVRCVGRYYGAPMLAFLHKGGQISNLTGEKLSEFQVVQSVEAAVRQLRLRLGTYSMAPCWDDEAPYYALFVEEPELPGSRAATRLAVQVDRHLREANCEYDGKRSSDRLQRVRVVTVPVGFWSRWDRERLAKSGGTAEQYKHPCLIPDLDFAGEARTAALAGRAVRRSQPAV